MKTITDIVRDVTNSTKVFKIDEITEVSAENKTYIISSCDKNTYWLMPCMTVEIGGIKAVIQFENFEQNVSILVKAKDVLSLDVESFDIPLLGFVHGDVPMAALTIDDARKQTLLPAPFLYLYKKFPKQKGNRFDRNAETGIGVEIYAVNDIPSRIGETWLQDQHDKYLINPLNSLIDFVIERIAKDKNVNRSQFLNQTNIITEDNTKWGDFKGTKGNEKSRFNRNLDSVGVKLNIPVLKTRGCKCSNCCI